MFVTLKKKQEVPEALSVFKTEFLTASENKHVIFETKEKKVCKYREDGFAGQTKSIGIRETKAEKVPEQIIPIDPKVYAHLFSSVKENLSDALDESQTVLFFLKSIFKSLKTGQNGLTAEQFQSVLEIIVPDGRKLLQFPKNSLYNEFIKQFKLDFITHSSALPLRFEKYSAPLGIAREEKLTPLAEAQRAIVSELESYAKPSFGFFRKERPGAETVTRLAQKLRGLDETDFMMTQDIWNYIERSLDKIPVTDPKGPLAQCFGKISQILRRIEKEFGWENQRRVNRVKTAGFHQSEATRWIPRSVERSPKRVRSKSPQGEGVWTTDRHYEIARSRFKNSLGKTVVCYAPIDPYSL